MKKLLNYILPCLAAVGAASCDTFEYHPYSVRLEGNCDINTRTIELLEAKKLSFPFKFAFITDTQGSYDEAAEALEIIKQRGDIEFIINGGDVSDFGLPKEFLWYRDMFEECGIPYLTVIGNHDCLGNGEDTFDYLFGPENYSLNIGKLHLVCLNTVALEYDYSKPVPDLDFIERDRMVVEQMNVDEPGAVTHTVIAMHSRPYDEQFNNNVAKAFNYYISQYPGMCGENGVAGFCLNGHNHYTDVSDIFENGILYYQCANAAKREFFVFTITEDGYEYEKVAF